MQHVVTSYELKWLISESNFVHMSHSQSEPRIQLNLMLDKGMPLHETLTLRSFFIVIETGILGCSSLKSALRMLIYFKEGLKYQTSETNLKKIQIYLLSSKFYLPQEKCEGWWIPKLQT